MKLAEMEKSKWYWLGQSIEESRHHYFLKQTEEWEYYVWVWDLIDTDAQRDDAYNSVDLLGEWREEVYNWNTEDSFESWSEDVDIRDYFSPESTYDCPTEVYRALNSHGYLINWEYPSYYDSFKINQDFAEDIEEWDSDTEFINDIKKELHLNEMVYLSDLKPIR